MHIFVEHRKMKNIVYILGLVVMLVISYFIYDYFMSTKLRCNQIHQQTSLNFSTKIKVLKDRVGLNIGKSNIQKLSDSAQKVAINLQACCVAASNHFIDGSQYLECQKSANNYEKILTKLSQNTETQLPEPTKTIVKPMAVPTNNNDNSPAAIEAPPTPSAENGRSTEIQPANTKANTKPQPDEIEALVDEAMSVSDELNQKIKSLQME